MRIKFKSILIPFLLEPRSKPFTADEIVELTANLELYATLKEEQRKVMHTLMSNQETIKATSDTIEMLSNMTW